jgi:hypothetical protein
MDFKLVSKNNVGAVATLFLVILLSQSRFFDFLIGTALGRAIIILFILGISYTNKILGVVAVLFIIISFNNSNIGYLEGFTSPNTNANATTNATTNTNANTNDNATATTTNATATTTTNANAPNTNANAPNTNTNTTTKAPNDKLNEKKSESKGIEGYNITEREGMMLRGKRSSEVPVYSNARNQGDDVEPSDKTVFAGNYSSI